jgi:peptidoglycan/LPS O-acetylase OafA/YrhL
MQFGRTGIQAMGGSTRENLLGYVPGLDGIRAVAVLLVLAFHAQVPALNGGFLGVDVFFVLSGYLISTLLLQEIDSTGSVAFRSFWRRRLVRLFPAMAALIAAFLLVAPWLTSPPQAALLQAMVTLLYLSDYVRAFGKIPDYLGHSWSLAVEAKFYLIWPLILTACARRMPPNTLVWVIVLLAFVATSWRIFNVQIGLPWDMIYFRFDTRLSGLLIGSALAAALRAGLRPNLPAWAGFLPLALVPMLSRRFGDPFMLSWAPIAFELATVLLILVVLQGSGMIARVLAFRPMVSLGLLSYGIYLWHYPIMRILRDDMHWASTLLFGATMSIALAWLSLHTIERWAGRYRTARGDSAPACRPVITTPASVPSAYATECLLDRSR